jgi:hypothetical protein
VQSSRSVPLRRLCKNSNDGWRPEFGASNEMAANSGLGDSRKKGVPAQAANISPERLTRRHGEVAKATKATEAAAAGAQLTMYPPELPKTHDPRELQEHHSPELELQLLRNGVRSMAAGRWACSKCGRSPLVGERLQIFGDGGSERVICALCLSKVPAPGTPLRTERVRAGGGRLTVRRAA